jgi:hypothetical protein
VFVPQISGEVKVTSLASADSLPGPISEEDSTIPQIKVADLQTDGLNLVNQKAT